MVVDVIDGEIVGYMSTQDVADFLGVKQVTVRQWIRRGKVTPLTIKSNEKQFQFIERTWALEKFREMYPDIAAMADSKKKQHSHFRVNGKNRKYGH